MTARYNRLIAAGKKDEAEKYLLSDPNDKSVYSSAQTWNDNVIDVSLSSTYNFIATVIDNIQAIYKEAGVPLTTIHFGGDEVPRGVWEKSPAYQAFKTNHPEMTSPGDMWYYYYGRVDSILKSKGLKLAGWEEAPLRRTKLDGRPVWQRLAAREYDPQRTQVVIPATAVGHQHRQLRTDTAQHGHPVPGYRLACRLRRETLQDHRAGTQVNRGGMAGPQPEPERHRYDGQEYVVGCQYPVGDGLLVKVVPTVLCVHHTLGQPRGTGGGVDQEDVVGAELRLNTQRPRLHVGVQAQCPPILAQDQQ